MFRLPLLFIATGIVSFVLFHAGSLVTAGGWAIDHPRSPDGWFRIHLLVLDWATMVAMGAVYQLIDVVLQRRIYSRMLGYVHYVFFTGGTVILLAGFLQSRVEWIAVGAVAAVIGILLFVWNVGRTLWEAKRWNPITLSTACALLYLAMTGLLGLAMGLNFAFQFWIDLHERLLAAHIWLGTLGWFGLLITGFSYKMLPMFYLSHGASDRPQYYILGLWNAAVLLGVGASLVPGGWSGLTLGVILLLAAALLAYDRLIRDIRKHSHKASPGRGIVWTLWSTRALLIFCILSFCIGLAAPSILWGLSWSVIAGWVYLWGWVAVTVLGYMSKIVPFLWWTHKYGDQAGRPGVPVMSDLISERSVDAGMWVMAAGLLVAVAGMGYGTASCRYRHSGVIRRSVVLYRRDRQSIYQINGTFAHKRGENIMTTQVNEDTVRRQLMLVFDPELGVNVVDLGLIYGIDIKDGHIAIQMTLTTPGCPLHDTIIGGVRRALEGKPGVAGVSVEVVWEPQWTPERMSDEAKRQLSAW